MLLQEGQAAPAGCGVAIIDELTTVYLSLSGVLDAAKELEKLGKREADAMTRVRQRIPAYQLALCEGPLASPCKAGLQQSVMNRSCRSVCVLSA